MFIERKKKALNKFGLRTWCTEKTFRLSSRTPIGYLLKSCPGLTVSLKRNTITNNTRVSIRYN